MDRVAEMRVCAEVKGSDVLAQQRNGAFQSGNGLISRTSTQPELARMSADPIVIASAARTPMGAFQGALKGVAGTALGAAAIGEALKRSGMAADQVDEVIMGCVLPAGLGQAPARQAALGGGLPQSVPCATLNKVCGSGMKATMLAHDLIAAGSADIVVAGGMESMTNAPYLLDKARGGYRIGHGRVLDHMFLDGLEDAYDKGRADGHLCRGHRAALPIHPRCAGPLRADLAAARADRDFGGKVPRRDGGGRRRDRRRAAVARRSRRRSRS